jgi:hypothetical protein
MLAVDFVGSNPFPSKFTSMVSVPPGCGGSPPAVVEGVVTFAIPAMVTAGFAFAVVTLEVDFLPETLGAVETVGVTVFAVPAAGAAVVVVDC